MTQRQLTRPCSSTSLSAKFWQGHTLLEVLLALSLSTLIIYALFFLHQIQHTSLERLHAQARRAVAGFTALHLISTPLRFAGFTPALHTQKGLPLFGCTLGRPVGSIGHTYCRADPALHSDGLEVGYVANTDMGWGDTPTDCLGQTLLISPNENTRKKKPIFPGIWSVQRFFVQKSGVTGQPELYCAGSGRLDTAQPIVEGIEQLQVRYRLNHTYAAVDASALAPHQWAQVKAVELCVVARDVLEQASAKKMHYIDCNGLRRASTDGKQRTAFTTQVAMQNPKVPGGT